MTTNGASAFGSYDLSSATQVTPTPTPKSCSAWSKTVEETKDCYTECGWFFDKNDDCWASTSKYQGDDVCCSADASDCCDANGGKIAGIVIAALFGCILC